jgi:hypothetical protein
MNRALTGYFRCPDICADFHTNEPHSADQGFFRWGDDIICYGRSAVGHRSAQADASLYDVSGDVQLDSAGASLPFDPEEIVESLRLERYTVQSRESASLTSAIVRKIYYLFRPLLVLPIRKRLQKIHLRGWDKIPFPSWPVDTTVDRLHRQMLALAMKASGVEAMPFIWFWPKGYDACAIVTHDVEAPPGRDFCDTMMDIDESYGFKSSFQVVPEKRYEVCVDFLKRIKERGFEVNVHDLTHDGRLYADRKEFLERARRINQYIREFDAVGFRSGVLYRNVDWYDAYDFTYDMSMPNVGHLDPQHGGCCTVFPFFIGKIVELPLTCTQDHTLFNVFNDYSIELWKRQIETIVANNGLITVLVHPDYVIEARAQETYKKMLAYLAEMRDKNNIWAPLPRDVAQWWSRRSEMVIKVKDGAWCIEGPGSEDAEIAFAHVTGDTVTYSRGVESIQASSRSLGTPIHDKKYGAL